ncbi:MAG: EamA family transporter [Candidatus Limnocylindria bacterium]
MTDRSGDGSAGALGAGLVVLAAVSFGTLGPVTRFADEAGVGSLAIVSWRAAIGATAMIILLVALRQVAGRRPVGLRSIGVRDRWFIGTASMANLVLNLSMFIAFVRIEIGLALLVFYSYPAFVAIASVLRFGERLDGVRWAALGVSMLGLVLTLTGSGGVGELDAVGIGLAFIAALTQAFYVLAARHGFARIPPVESAALTMGGAAIGYLVIAAVTGQLASLASPLASNEALWPVLVAGFVGAAIPTLCFITGIRLLGAPRAAILATLEPVVGVALAAWLLNEQPGALQLIGGALILVAAVLLQLGSRTVAEHEAVAT